MSFHRSYAFNGIVKLSSGSNLSAFKLFHTMLVHSHNSSTLILSAEKTTQVLKEKVPFNDTENSELNILNVPVCDRNHQVSAVNADLQYPVIEIYS